MTLLELAESFKTSLAHQLNNPLRRTSEHIGIIYFQTFIIHDSYGPRVNCINVLKRQRQMRKVYELSVVRLKKKITEVFNLGIEIWDRYI